MRTTAPVLAALLVAGCDLTATAEADEVCVNEPTSQRIPGAALPAGTPTATVTVPTDIRLDLGAALPADLNRNGVATVVLARSITVTTAEGVDLSGVASASLTVTATGQQPVAFRYQRAAGAPAPTTAITATPERPVNLVDYLEGSRTIRISSITVEGAPPRSAWTPTVRTCGSAKVSVDELRALGL